MAKHDSQKHHRRSIRLKGYDYSFAGAYVIMPNHVHGIIVIANNDVRAMHASPLRKRPRGVLPGSLGAIIGSYKSAVTKRIGREMNETGIWQRSYYEHIIRDEPPPNLPQIPRNLGEVSRPEGEWTVGAINANPLLWDQDDENSINVNPDSK